MLGAGGCAFLLLGAAAVQAQSGPDDDVPKEFDCAMRRFVLQRSAELLPDGANAASIFRALQLDDCGEAPPTAPPGAAVGGDDETPCPIADPAARRVYVSPGGDDDSGDGSLRAPLRSLQGARDALRRLRGVVPTETADVIVRGGLYAMEAPLELGEADGLVRYAACPGEEVILSGARHLDLTFERSSERPKLFVAEVPGDLPQGVDQLFVDAGGGAVGSRMVWAREPNGNAETDLQPVGFALAEGNPLGDKPPPAGAAPYASLWAPLPRRNNSCFPDFGRDADPRGGGNIVWLHEGGNAALYADNRNFWNQTMPKGLQWNSHGGTSHGFPVAAFNASGWPSSFEQKPLLHCMHADEWGNHIWEVDRVSVADRTFHLGNGGWQEARFVAIHGNPFYVEGAFAALDQAGEWWLDESSGKLWMIPNVTEPILGDTFDLSVAIPLTATLIDISGSSDAHAGDMSFEGFTFAHTKRTLMERYVVPSPGDWSVHAGGVVVASGAKDIAVRACTFNRTGGNAVALLGGVANTTIENCEMEGIGDSAVVLIGRLPGLGNDGSDKSLPLSYPTDTKIIGNHIHDIGVWGKQTAALFQAVSCRTTFRNNVAYNGPRAGVNINDGFCGGHHIEGNVLFNWVRETQDHGPINTWDRAAYKQPDGGLEPEWTRVVHNLIMNGPAGNRDLGNLFPAVDNDDGSAYYWIAENVAVYGGFKNFLGHDKIWTNNLVLYPEGRTGDQGNGPCITHWAGEYEAYINNTCLTRDPARAPYSATDVSAYPVGCDLPGHKCLCDFADPDLRPMLPELSHNVYMTQTAAYQFRYDKDDCSEHTRNYSLAEMQSMGVELGSSVRGVPPTEELIATAAALLGSSSLSPSFATAV